MNDNQNQEFNLNYDSSPKPYKRQKGKTSIILILIVALIGGVIGSAITNLYLMGGNVPKQNNVSNTVIKTTGEVNVATAVAEKAMPSVVGITTKGLQRSFFGVSEVQGTGSGIIVDDRGYILTNAHVVKLNNQVVDKCTVALNNNETVEGKPVWVDTTIDIALVKINTKTKLQAATLGNSDDLQIGQTAIAIGNPINMVFQRSVTQGIISGLNRYLGQVSGGGYMMGLIQTDASINGGNSGGPLLNAKGEVIGINTVKVQTAEGLGFAIPIDSVKPIIKQVIETGDYKVVSLGVQSLDVEAAKRIFNEKISADSGIMAFKVYEGSPAQKAGIQQGDIITGIDNNKITNNDTLKAVLYKYTVGDKAQIHLIRNGKEMTAELTFTQYSVADDKNAQKDLQQQQQAEKQRQQQQQQQRQQQSFPFSDFFGGSDEQDGGF